MRLYDSRLASWIWTWCALGRTRGESPPACGPGKPGPSGLIAVVALNLWDHLGRHVTPMLAVYATGTMVVTVAAGTQCAWYELMGPWMPNNHRQDPGLDTSYFTNPYIHLQVILVSS